MLKMILLLSITSILSFAVNVTNFIDLSKCDQIINKHIYKICYSYDKKSLLGGWTTLEGNLVYRLNIKKRPRFYPEMTIPREYRTYYKDYTHSGYDRGHTVIADADADYSPSSLEETYSMANITFQSRLVNRKTWLKAEKYGRYVAHKLGYVKSITIVRYSKKRIHGISVPKTYYRIYYNNDKDFLKCFKYDNNKNVDVKRDRLRDHLIDCKRIMIHDKN